MRNAPLFVVLVSLALVVTGCKKDKPALAGGSGSAGSAVATAGSAAGSAEEPGPAASCQDASKVYAKLMAASPGNPLSDMKPSDGVVHLFAVTIEEGCDNMWSPKTRSCIAKLTSVSGVAGCFDNPQEAADLTAGVALIVDEFKANKAANDKAAAEAAGSGSGSAAEAQ